MENSAFYFYPFFFGKSILMRWKVIKGDNKNNWALSFYWRLSCKNVSMQLFISKKIHWLKYNWKDRHKVIPKLVTLDLSFKCFKLTCPPITFELHTKLNLKNHYTIFTLQLHFGNEKCEGIMLIRWLSLHRWSNPGKISGLLPL